MQHPIQQKGIEYEAAQNLRKQLAQAIERRKTDEAELVRADLEHAGVIYEQEVGLSKLAALESQIAPFRTDEISGGAVIAPLPAELREKVIERNAVQDELAATGQAAPPLARSAADCGQRLRASKTDVENLAAAIIRAEAEQISGELRRELQRVRSEAWALEVRLQALAELRLGGQAPIAPDAINVFRPPVLENAQCEAREKWKSYYARLCRDSEARFEAD